PYILHSHSFPTRRSSDLALIGLIFKAFIAKELALDENLIERAFTSYVLAYLSFKISYIETRRVALIFIPLLVHSLTMALVVRSGDRKSTRLNSSHVSISY